MSKPHKISAYECILDGDQIIEERLRSVAKFDDEGKVVAKESFDSEGDPSKREEYEYVNGILIRSKEDHPVEGNSSESRQEYIDGLLMSQKEYFNDQLTLEMKYTYNEEGQLILNDVLNSDGSTNSRYTYEYQGPKTIEKYFDEDLTPVRIIETTDNAEGDPIDKKVTEVYEDREVIHEQRIEYEVEDNEHIKTYHNDGKEAFQIIEELDPEGRLTCEVRFDILNDVETVSNLEYNEEGKIIREVVTENDEVIRTTDLVLDEHGNRIEVREESLVGDDHVNVTVYRFVNEY